MRSTRRCEPFAPHRCPPCSEPTIAVTTPHHASVVGAAHDTDRRAAFGRLARSDVLANRPVLDAVLADTGVSQIELDFPELTIVCGHICYPWTVEMIAVADKHQNVYIDTSAYTAKRYPAELVE